MILSMLLAGLVIALTVLFEDIQEANSNHGLLTDWWYGKNRWEHKYKGKPYTMANLKWWAKIGLTAFIDLWHLAKFFRVLLFCWLVTFAFGLPWWMMFLGWGLYGGLHDHVFYNKLFRK